MGWCDDEKKKFKPGYDWNSLDPTGIATTVEKCKEKMKVQEGSIVGDKTKEADLNEAHAANNAAETARVDCAKAVMGVVGSFDPSGIISLASAFVHKTCYEKGENPDVKQLLAGPICWSNPPREPSWPTSGWDDHDKLTKVWNSKNWNGKKYFCGMYKSYCKSGSYMEDMRRCCPTTCGIEKCK